MNKVLDINTRGTHAQRASSGDQPEKKAYKAVGHDRQLQDAQYGGNLVKIRTIDHDTVSGTIDRRDKYTITLRRADGGCEIFYKHAIQSIEIKPVATKAD